MKAVILGVFVLGLLSGALGSVSGAQTAAPERMVVVAESVSVMSSGVRELRGKVEIRIGSVRIAADEADFDSATKEWRLRGNVRLTEQ